MNKQVLKIVFGALIVTACGSEAKKSQDAAAPSLPVAAIVRVPVGADGQEDSSKAELRVQQAGAKAEGQDQVVAAFDKGEQVAAKQASELDGNASTQSWCYGGYGYGYGYGYSYAPSYYYYGNYYGYGYGKSYYGYGYKYYYYY